MTQSAASNDQPIYISEMMQRLGLDPGGGVVPRFGLSYATARHCCEACVTKRDCRQWLDRMPSSVPFAPRFCPCADVLFELQVNELRPHQAPPTIENEPTTGTHAYAGDLDRLEEEIEELLLQKPVDDPAVADLKHRKLRLQTEIEALRRQSTRS